MQTGTLIIALGLLALALVFALVALLHSRQQLKRLRRQQASQQATRDDSLRREAVAAERNRIYNDLHDDLGAKLLGLVHAASTPEQADLARSILQDLRDTVTRSRGTAGNLVEVLAEIRNEARQRLQRVGIDLIWQEVDPVPELPLEAGQALHLYRISREAISNTIRHASAKRLRIRLRCDAHQLGFELTDDGAGIETTPLSAGTGVQSMRQRAAQLSGDIHWTPGTEGGTKVLLSFPLPAEAKNA